VTDTLAAALAAFQAEQWRPVPGAPGYEVSDQGRVRSVPRVVLRSNGSPFTVKGCILRPQVKRSGHLKVELRAGSRQVHEVVLSAFVGPRPDGMECLHGNGDPADNRLTNLRWGTRKENVADAIRHGWDPRRGRTHCPQGHALTLPNLIPSMLPNHGCLACNRARARVQWLRTKGVDGDHHELADTYYAAITGGDAA